MLSNLATRAPRIALGTDKVNGSECIDYIRRGLAAGYRMIDTAQVYRNETEIGEAIRNSSIPREQVFVTTKIATGFKKNPGSFKEAVDSARGSITRLGLEYVDTILIHHPGDDAADPLAAICRRMTWQALEELVLEGCVKNIGVSNFNTSHISEMQHYARVLPCINQIELHPWCQQRKLVDYCKTEKISIQACSAIARNTHSENAELQTMAVKNNMSTAQLLLRYSLQKGYMPIVKAKNPRYLYANIKVENLVISEKEMAVLDSWDKGIEGALFPWLMSPIMV
ncbi:putative aldo-keto reductase [Phaeosphaeriaceae sp. PMI808]|nr:putative aldo-keto reductase [Phaeosphaeriaceae sp. PMI808]